MDHTHPYDVAIIGGGINGCGCAADAASRGLSVFLCDQGDIASQTSSRSSQLIHGGLRYLEQYDLALVKKALDEQQILLDIAPHLVHELPFVLPRVHHSRPPWLLRTGLFLYDHLSMSNHLPNSQALQRDKQPAYFAPLHHDITEGFLFYDCQTDDARLTLLNALQAQQHQATIATYTKLIQATTVNGRWQLHLETNTHQPYTITAKTIINAAGPWVGQVNQILNVATTYPLSHVKGSHVVVHPLYEGQHAYLLQHTDGRVIFVMPYHGYSLIGTTDIPYTGDLRFPSIEPHEIHYLQEALRQGFAKTFTTADIITHWSGIRTLHAADDVATSRLSRDYTVHYQNTPQPVVTLYGGKITTYRQLAKEAVDTLHAVFKNLPPSITQQSPLPGAADFQAYRHEATEKYHWLTPEILSHYLKTYGTLTEKLLDNRHTMQDLGTCFTPLLYQAEVDYLKQNEWVTCSEDLLWRRTKLGLGIDAESVVKLRGCF